MGYGLLYVVGGVGFDEEPREAANAERCEWSEGNAFAQGEHRPS
jgi:hypothetical protein